MKTTMILRCNRNHLSGELAGRGIFEYDAIPKMGKTVVREYDWGRITISQRRDPAYPGLNFLMVEERK